jgi:hypothetical protein
VGEEAVPDRMGKLMWRGRIDMRPLRCLLALMAQVHARAYFQHTSEPRISQAVLEITNGDKICNQ